TIALLKFCSAIGPKIMPNTIGGAARSTSLITYPNKPKKSITYISKIRLLTAKVPTTHSTETTDKTTLAGNSKTFSKKELNVNPITNNIAADTSSITNI